jgi:hypothetical protein
MQNLQKDSVQNGDQMTLFSQVDFLASHTASQESDLAKTILDTFGRKCLESFEKLSRHGSWAKTFAALLVGTGEWYSTRCNLTWKLSATKSSRLFFQLVPSTPRIDATGFGLLQKEMMPTPTSRDWKGGLSEASLTGSKGQKFGMTVPDYVKKVILPKLLKTPTTADAYSENLTKKEQRMGNSGTLAQEIQSGFVENRWPGLLPTPLASEAIERRNMKTVVKIVETGSNQTTLTTMAKYGGLLPTPMASDSPEKNPGKRNQASIANLARFQTGTTSQLNPLFVCEMMGFPPNWLELPFLSTETNQSKPTETQ